MDIPEKLTVEAINNGHSRETGNIGYTRHKTNKRQRITVEAINNGHSRETGKIGYTRHNTKTNNQNVRHFVFIRKNHDCNRQFLFLKERKKQQKNNHFRRYYIVKIIYVNTSTKIHHLILSDKLLGSQFCLFLRFWYLILELFRQCGTFCFSCYWCKQKSWLKHISGWITRVSIHAHLDL